METPLTPLEFARRARKLYPERVAVVDGNSSWTYAQFIDRCDRWSAVLQQLGIRAGDRVAYLSPNTHAQLESFYSVPQIGAVLVPLNYRLIADDFVYLINHSGARMVCADGEYLPVIDRIRSQLPQVEHFVALTGEANEWLNYESAIAKASAEFVRPEI
ncbi:MAG: AMP-binding protein, partial [Chthoniobacterales bacterium]